MLTDRIWSPKLNESILTAITDCSKCKNFGLTHIHSLLNPITRWHPLELLVGATCQCQKEREAIEELACTWMCIHNMHGPSKGSENTTISSLGTLFRVYLPSETFMTDSGPHFVSKAVDVFCKKWGVKHHVTLAYSPWVNGLMEGTNKLMLHVLKQLVAPELR